MKLLSDNLDTLPDNLISLPDKSENIPEDLQAVIDNMGKRMNDTQMKDILLALCSWKPFTIKELAAKVGRNEKYLYEFVTPLREQGRLAYTIPETPNHPDQAYVTVGSLGLKRGHTIET